MLTEILTRLFSVVGSGTLVTTGVLAPLGGTMIVTSTFLTGVTLMITNEIINRMHNRYNKLLAFLNNLIISYEKTLQKSMEDKLWMNVNVRN